MPKYRVSADVTYVFAVVLEVDAESPEEAKDLVRKHFDQPLCNPDGEDTWPKGTEIDYVEEIKDE